MNKKKTIRRIVVIMVCLLAGGGMASLLIAANRKEATRYCKSIKVTVNASDDKAYISKEDIVMQLQSVAKDGIVNKSIRTINVAMLEHALETHAWIRDAELYFDTHDVLHVTVAERVPVARVFTTAGSTFYLDTAGQRMPLLPNVHVRVPVITGFTTAKKLRKQDSIVKAGATTIARYLDTHPFWNAQIAQIDIMPAGTFELIPVVGNHIIRIGSADDIEEKLANLLLFYKQVLRNTGFDKYAVVDVQYKDQVIGSNEKVKSAIDSVQLQKNIQELMRKIKLQAEADSLAVIEMNKAAASDTSLLKGLAAPFEPEKKVNAAAELRHSDSAAAKLNSDPKKIQSNTVRKPAIPEAAPKAVMKKRGL